MSLKLKDVEKSIKKSGLNKKTINLHSSFKSFGEADFSPADLIKRFLKYDNTLVVPTFSFEYGIEPPENMRYAQNGFDYENHPSWNNVGKDIIYTTESNKIDLHEMGVIPKAVLEMKDRVRGNHPFCSFAAVGPFAHEIIKPQEPMDVYAPLREVALFKGVLMLMGVGFTRATIIHLAEQMAGRNMFVRWANGKNKEVIEAETGGCSEGFDNFEGYFSGIENKITVGESLWRSFDAGKFLKMAARVIQLHPKTTMCKDKKCLRCSDMVKGGVLQSMK